MLHTTSMLAAVFTLALCSVTANAGPRLTGVCIGTAALRASSDLDDTTSIQRAVSSGQCVHLESQGRELVVSSDIKITHPSQLIYGDGRLETRIRSGDPHGFKKGMFVAETGEPGPIFRDFGVFYNQPDVSNPNLLITYPPAFFLDATPRFRMEHMGCYVATICIEAKSNSGGAIFQDVQIAAFKIGIDIDDAYDSIRLQDVHWGPFYLSESQRSIFLNSRIGHAVGIRLGRVDDFHVVDGTFYGGQGMEIRPSTKDGSVGFGSVRGCDFDNYSGLFVANVGSVDIIGNEFTLGLGGTSLEMDGGVASVVGNKFLLAAPGSPVVLNAGSMTMLGNNFATGQVDASLVTQRGAGSRLILSGNLVERDADRDYMSPIFDLRAGSTTAMGNVVSPLGGGHRGTAFAVGNDNGDNRFIGNVASGWRYGWPSVSKGIYRDN